MHHHASSAVTTYLRRRRRVAPDQELVDQFGRGARTTLPHSYDVRTHALEHPFGLFERHWIATHHDAQCPRTE